MLRVGMTNPPFILEHLQEIAEVLRHPCVYSFLHVPVQSGSDAVLTVSTIITYKPLILIQYIIISLVGDTMFISFFLGSMVQLFT